MESSRNYALLDRVVNKCLERTMHKVCIQKNWENMFGPICWLVSTRNPRTVPTE